MSSSAFTILWPLALVLLPTHLIALEYFMSEKKKKKGFCPTLCSSTVSDSYKRSILHSVKGLAKKKTELNFKYCR